MRDWRAILGKNVRKFRQQRRLTQEQLAFEAQIDLTYLGGIERGKLPLRWYPTWAGDGFHRKVNSGKSY